MRIGILPNLDPAGGGIYQYSQNILHALNTWSDNRHDDRFVLLSNDDHNPPAIPLEPSRWEIKTVVTRIRRPFRRWLGDEIRWAIGEGPHRDALRWLWRKWLAAAPVAQSERHFPDPEVILSRPDLRKCFLRSKLDFVVYTYPTPISFETGMPYVMAVHDLQHRLQPEFPEVSADGQWEYREYLFRNGCRHATLIVAESEVGKEDVLNFYGRYGVSEAQVKVLPYLPAAYLAQTVAEAERRRVRAVYDLPERYLFYPAQFWPHKNHARIVEAMGLLKREYQVEVPIVFCGSYGGEIRENAYQTVMALASNLGVDRQIYYLGYAPDEDMSALYSEAVALVMPTFFGPTNIPVLEAWAFDCPVLTSDIRGIREQTGDAAVLVDPCAGESIAEGIYRLWTDEKLRFNLAHAGRRHLSSYTPEDFRSRLIEIVEEAKDRVRSAAH